MPSLYAEPTLDELLQAFADGIRSQRDRHVDAREGSLYQHWGGVAAVLWSRNARRDTDLWRAIYLDSAEAKDLTNLLADRYDFDRITDTYGTGTVRLRRATAVAAGGTVWRGTRITVFGTSVESKTYVVLQDWPVGATELVATLPVRALMTGPGTKIDIGTGAARVEDPLWDTTWTVDALTCDDGTAHEPAEAARARFRDSRLDARPGYVESIVKACKEAGATNALIFPSDFGGEAVDYGLNMAYVGDAGFQGDDALVRRVSVALEGKRVLGDQMQVRPLTRVNVTFQAKVNLWDSPSRVAQADVLARLTGAVQGYFSGSTSGFFYDRDAIVGAMMKAAPEMETATIVTPSSNAGVLSIVGGQPNFPDSLPRYFLSPNDITLELLPPL